MNVLFVSDFEISPIAGGMEKLIHTISREFMKRGIGCYEAVFRFKNIGKSSSFDGVLDLEGGICFEKINDFIVENKVDVVITALSQKRNFVPYMSKLYAITQSVGCKLVYGFYNMPGFELKANMPFRLALSRLRNGEKTTDILLPFVTTLFNKCGISFLLEFLLRKKLKSALYSDLVVVLAEKYIDDYKRLLKLDVKDVPFVAIPNPLSFEKTEEMVDLSQKGKNVINISRYDVAHKGQTYLLDVWCEIENDLRLQEWKLILVGYGQDEQYVLDYAKKKNLQRVEFRGACDPRELYKQSSIYAKTSYFEGLPMVVLDAMQYAVVPISVDSYGAVYDIIDDCNSGMIAKSGDIEDYVAKLKTLMLDETKRMKMAQLGQNVYDRFSTEAVVERWISVLNDLIKQ